MVRKVYSCAEGFVYLPLGTMETSQLKITELRTRETYTVQMLPINLYGISL
jgi:hypothetical protein